MGTVKKIVIFNFGQKVKFLTILKISDFCQKCGFWIFWEVTGDSGIPEISIFLILGRFQNFVFFDFLGGRKILVGGYGAVLVGVSQYDVRISQDSLPIHRTI